MSTTLHPPVWTTAPTSGTKDGYTMAASASAAGHDPWRAFDGDVTTEWRSPASYDATQGKPNTGAGEHVELELPQEQSIIGFDVTMGLGNLTLNQWTDGVFTVSLMRATAAQPDAWVHVKDWLLQVNRAGHTVEARLDTGVLAKKLRLVFLRLPRGRTAAAVNELRFVQAPPSSRKMIDRLLVPGVRDLSGTTTYPQMAAVKADPAAVRPKLAALRLVHLTPVAITDAVFEACRELFLASSQEQPNKSLYDAPLAAAKKGLHEEFVVPGTTLSTTDTIQEWIDALAHESAWKLLKASMSA
jgi:hypothetical protein